MFRRAACRRHGQVVDEEETKRLGVAQQVEAFGLTVLLASEGQEAVETYRSQTAEIVAVLLDMTMPHMSGIEAFREIRRSRADSADASDQRLH